MKCQFSAVCVSQPDDSVVCECAEKVITLDSPVCASNGQTYSNLAAVQLASCRLGKQLTVKHDDACGMLIHILRWLGITVYFVDASRLILNDKIWGSLLLK